MPPAPSFLPLAHGTRFCILHSPPDDVPVRGAIVFVHPFGEEMNKSRRMAALQSRAFAEAGWTTLQPDLFGCGDSPGDFAEARWDQWVSDVVGAAAWLHETGGVRPLLWGLRTGCLLAAAASCRMPGAPDLLFWQPVLSGKQYLQQFLRLKGASELVARKNEQITSNQALRKLLERGEVVEIAGYRLSPELASGVESAELDLPAGRSGIAWIEVRGSAGEVGPASRNRMRALESKGHRVTSQVVPGPAFWNIFEAEPSPALIRASVSAAEALQS